LADTVEPPVRGILTISANEVLAVFRSLVIGLVLAGLYGATGQSQTPQKTVVFVCEHGAAKSVVAAAHFNRLAQARGLPFRAVSRGTVPDPSVPGFVREGLKSDAAPVEPSFAPTLVTSQDTAAAARVVTFDVKLPRDVQSAPATNWTDIPNFSDGYGPARTAIVGRVEALLRELSAAR
jgi:arsenate reductase